MKGKYEKLLDRGRSMLPSATREGSRFEVPPPDVATIGSRTIIHNYERVCRDLNRNPRHVLKFLLRELGTAGSLEGGHVVLQGKFTKKTIEGVLKRYVDDFIICPICKRPDTRIERRKRLQFLLCEACGARSSLSYLR